LRRVARFVLKEHFKRHCENFITGGIVLIVANVMKIENRGHCNNSILIN
jgi:hypothetical protein